MILRPEDYRGNEVEPGGLGISVAVTLLMCVWSCIPVMKGTFCEWLIQLRFYFKPSVHVNFEVRQVLLQLKKKKVEI